MPSEQEDRALVERVWVWHQQHANGSICIALDVRRLFPSYADAAEYTRKALLKVEEIKEEIDWIQGAFGADSVFLVPHRILAREQAALAEARKGMKEGVCVKN